MEIPAYIAQLLDAGVLGVLLAVIVFVIIYIARFTELLKTGNMARAANVIASVLLSGLGIDLAVGEKAFSALVAVVLSSVIHKLVEWILGRWKKDS